MVRDQLVLASCGGDDDEEAATPTTAVSGTGGTAGTTTAPGPDGTDVAAYCEAVLAIETTHDPDIDFESASPEGIAAVLRPYAQALSELVDDAVAVAPDEIAADAAVAAGAIDEVAATGDPSVLDDPAFEAANARIHAFDRGNCGWNVEEVAATEYAFDGLPDELPAGPTSFELANDGAELHELVLVRINDGVTQTAEELLALPEEEALALVTMVPGPAFAAPGDDDYVVADLEPGNYAAVCFVPVGATGDGPPPDGPPHALEGMVAESPSADHREALHGGCRCG